MAAAAAFAATSVSPASAYLDRLDAAYTTVFHAEADARVEQAFATANFGDSYLRADGGGDPMVESYVRFTVTGLPGVLVGAQLRVHATSPTVDGPAVFMAANDWGEQGVTWSNRPAHLGGAGVDTGPVSAGTWIEYDVSRFVSGQGTYTFLLSSSSSDGVNLDSRESASPPELEVVTVPDTVAPTPPSAPAVTSSTQTSISLLWTPSTDNVAVAGYNVYVNGANVGSTATASHVIAGLACGTSYSLGVDAFDAAGNRSLQTWINAGTDPCLDAEPPTAPGNLAATAPRSTESALSWTAATDDVGVVGYDVYRNAARIASLPPRTSFSDLSVAPGTSYEYFVRARDSAGNVSAPSNIATVTTGAAEAGLHLFPDVADARVEEAAPTVNFGRFATLRADGGNDPAVESYARFDVAGLSGGVANAKLRLYARWPTSDGPSVYPAANNWSEDAVTWGNRPGRSGDASDDAGSIAEGSWVEYDVTRLVNGNGAYTFLLATTSSDGVDFEAREGPLSPRLIVTAAVSDTTPPSPPGAVSATGSTQTSVSLSWGASTDDFGVAGYGVYVDAARVGSTSATSHTVSGLSCGRSYTLAVDAFDAAGNRSDRTSVVSATDACPDTEAPAAPADLVAVAVDSSHVALTWRPATDNVLVTGYDVYRNGALLGSVPAITTYSDATVAPASTYEYSVKARDAAGNVSAPSNGSTVTTPPAPPGGVRVFTAEADARVEATAPAANFGAMPLLRTDGGGDPEVESYLRFEVGGLSAPPASAKLRLYARSPTSDGPALFSTVAGWTEGVITWSNRPGPSGGAVADAGSVAAGSWVEYDVTALVSSNGSHSFLLQTGSYDGVDFDSREAEFAPRLVVTPLGTPPNASCDKVAARTGSDSGSGTASSPFRTVQKLADSLSAGQTGCLRQGVYDDTSDGLVLTVKHGGQAGAPITIRSYPGERAKVLGIAYVRSGSEYVTLSTLDFEGTGGQNTIQVNAADVTVEDSDITNVRRGNSCMILGGNDGWGGAPRAIVRRNRFHDCGNPIHGNKDHAIYAANVQNGQIVDNWFWNTQSYAIQLYPNAQGTRFAHNVVDGDTPSVRGGVLFGGDSRFASSDNVVERNVIAYAQSHNIESTWSGAVGTGNVARNNCLWAGKDGNVDESNGGFSAIDNLVALPLFVDRMARDYRLASGSLCLSVVGLGVGG